MIVECGNCETRFQLDSSRVPARGIRVRCSNCKEAFFLRHPDATNADAAHDSAAAALDEPSPTPDETRDLPASDASHDRSFADARDEEDWEFNDELPVDDGDDDSLSVLDDAGSEYDAIDFDGDSEPMADVAGAELGIGEEDSDDAFAGQNMSYSVEYEEDSGLDLADDSSYDLATGDSSVQDPATDELVAAPGAEAQDGGMDDSGRDADADDSTPQEQQVGRSDLTEFGEASDFSDVADEVESITADPSVEVDRTSGVSEGVDEALDVGQPEDWDFLSEETLEPPLPVGGATGQTSVATAAESAAGNSTASGPDLAGSSTMPARPVQTPLKSFGHGVGWAITLALFVVGAGWGVLRAPTAAYRTPVVADFGDFHAESVRGAWLDTAAAGPMYVVTGHLVNDSLEARRPAGVLRVALVAASGGPLAFPLATAGVPLGEQHLRESPRAEIEPLQMAAASDLSWGLVKPGEVRDFLAYFTNVPDAAAGFVLEMDSTGNVGMTQRSAETDGMPSPAMGWDTQTGELALPSEVPTDGAG